jgi:hypothetical protein
MNISVAQAIRDHGAEALAVASGIPKRTLYRWAEKDEIPGSGVSQEWRLNQLRDALLKIGKHSAPKTKRRAA